MKKTTEKTILVVEDDMASCELFKNFLKTKGINTIIAENGYEAIEIIKNNPEVDLVLMDIKLPELDGSSAMIEIKKIRKDLPIIAETAYALKGDKRKFLSLGFDDYIAKPVKPDKLQAIISKHI
jgi:two-component system cell cycle response regulator DivK